MSFTNLNSLFHSVRPPPDRLQTLIRTRFLDALIHFFKPGLIPTLEFRFALLYITELTRLS